MAKLTIDQMKANLANGAIWRRVIISWIAIIAIVGALLGGIPALTAVPIIAIYFAIQFWKARHLLFSFSGRVGRKAFWLIIVSFVLADLPLIAIIVTAVRGIFHAPKSLTPMDGLWLTAALIVFVVIPTAAALIGLGVRRLHDLNWPSTWLLALYGIPALGLGLFYLPMIPQSARDAILPFVMVAGLLCAFGVLGFCRGVTGANEFGPDPNAHPVRQASDHHEVRPA